MKTLLLLCLILFSTLSKAFCYISPLSAYPESGPLNRNPVLLIEAHGEGQRILYQLNKQYPVYLRCGEKKVKLQVRELCKGQPGLCQALLVTESLLDAGLEYTLCIDSLPQSQNVHLYDFSKGDQKPYSYCIKADIDYSIPIVKGTPQLLRKEYTPLGCGPVVYATFSCPATDASGVLVRTTVKDLASGISTTYYLVPRNGEIAVGRGMCGGEFDLGTDKRYEVRFAFLDRSGNRASTILKPIPFTSPSHRLLSAKSG